jgi:MFS family permease
VRVLYQVQDSAALLKGHRGLLRRQGRARRVSRTVVLLGVVSMLTDISSEMVAAVLPAYLVYSLGFTPLQYGIVDGVYQGASALVRLVSGFVGDRFRRHKEVAASGYGLSAACKLALAAVGSAWGAVGAVILLDRTGKGIRTAPRDALISLNSEPDSLATSFGVHRALDTTGALIGPLAAFGLLAIAPLAFDSLFLVSFCIALVGVAVLVLFVDGSARAETPENPAPPPSLREAGGVLGLRGLRSLVALGGLLSLVTMSDAFVYLALEERVDFEPTVFPLLFVCTAGAYMLLAIPAGRIADRVGRTKVFMSGYGLLLLVYCVLLMPSTGWWAIPVALLLLGSYYAATDGVLMAIGGSLSPPHLRGTALAVLGTATSLGRLFASIIFGALWVAIGLEGAIACFGGALLATLVCAGIWLARGRGELADA